MVTQQEVERQLKQLGVSFRFICRPESLELAEILMPGEQIAHCFVIVHESVFVLCAATNQRILLIDKRPMFLNIEDIRYEMIMEVDYAGRLFDASLFIHTTNKKLQLLTIRQDKLRELRSYLQGQIMQVRQGVVQQPAAQLAQNWSRSVQTVAPLLARRRVPKFSLPKA
jgi:hypothetical protein